MRAQSPADRPGPLGDFAVASTRSLAPVRILAADERGLQPNWGLLMILAFNAAAWVGFAQLF